MYSRKLKCIMKKTPGHFEPKIEVLETFSSIEFSFSFVLDVRCFYMCWAYDFNKNALYSDIVAYCLKAIVEGKGL